MAAVPPKIALILSISLFGGVSVFLLGIPVWRHNLPLFLAMLFFSGVLGVGLVRPLSTKLTSAGISQLTWRGRKHLAWADVTHVARQPQTITLSGPSGRFIVPLMLYSNAGAAVAFLSSHLPLHLRGG
jgi:hypothetical protein